MNKKNITKVGALIAIFIMLVIGLVIGLALYFKRQNYWRFDDAPIPIEMQQQKIDIKTLEQEERKE